AGIATRPLRPQRGVGRVQIERGPARPRQWPRVLVALDETLAGVPYLKEDPGLLRPAGVLALEEVAEEPLLQAHAVVGVEVGPVLDAVHLEPLVVGGRSHEALEVAARVQPPPAPVARGEEGHAPPRPVGHARAPVLVAGQPVALAVVPEVVAVRSELFLAERRRAGHPLAVHPAAISARATAVLHAHDLGGKPGAGEGAQDA